MNDVVCLSIFENNKLYEHGFLIKNNSNSMRTLIGHKTILHERM